MQASGDDQHRIWILSGTGEGPPLTRSLLARGWRVQVSVVTDAAALAYGGLPVDQIRIGALDGQAAMARVLRSLGAETTLVIAHGLASDALYGDFDAIDVVEKAGDVSTVRVARSEQG